MVMTAGRISARTLVAFTVFLAACSPGEQSDAAASEAATPAETPEIAALRTVAAKYADVSVALAEGYIADPSGMCITAAMEGQPAELGAMGLHHFRPDLLGITATAPRVAGTGTHTDFNQPGVLIYEPQANGTLQLVAIENVVFEAGWRAAGNTAAPTFGGNAYVHMVDDPATPADEAHGFEPHYELHAWVPRANPRGMFQPFNPAVTCDHAAHAPAPGAQ
jgi:hypothetical protein